MILFCMAALFILRAKGYISQEDIINLIRSKKNIAPCVMAVLYMISPALILPTFYLTVLAGVLWGPFWGVIFDVSGSTTGSTIAFIISRYIGGDYISMRIKNNRFYQLLNYGGNSGWKLNAFLRLNPIFPSALIGYFFGLTSIKLKEFFLSTLIFLLPSCITIVYFSNLFAKSILLGQVKGFWVQFTVLTISLVVLLVIKKYLSVRIPDFLRVPPLCQYN